METPSPGPNSPNPESPDPDSPAPDRAELSLWLRLTLTKGVGPINAVNLLRAFKSPAALFDASAKAIAALVGRAVARRLLATDPAREQAICEALAWANQPNNHLLTLADTGYPQALLSLPDPPPLLYIRGQLNSLRKPALAIVGARHASRSGCDNAFAFARSLADHGLVIVSGLAHGIDGAAHRGAMAANGLTIAVMATGIERIYPAAHRDLAERIAVHGALLSEMPIGSAPLRANFPRRNRLVAGLSAGVLVVEAARQSGSLITARQAGEYGREVFAMPGSIHAPLARGCHQLIRDGARLVESVTDILTELPPGTGHIVDRDKPDNTALHVNRRDSADPNHTRLLEHIGWEPVSIDALLLDEVIPGGATQLAQVLLELELDGHIERCANGQLQRRGIRADN